MPLPKPNPRRISRAMEAEPEALGNATWSENNINTNGPVIALASNINTWAKQTSDNLRFVRETGWMVYDFQTGPLAGPNCALFGIGLFWAPQIGLTQVTQGDIFYTNGKRVDLYTQQILNDIGQANHTFPPNTSVWVYASGRYLETPDQTGGQGTPFPLALPGNVDLYFDDVGQGNLPNPPVGYTVVGGVLTNAIGIAASFGPQQIPAPYTLQSGLAISLPFLFDGDLTVNGNLTVQGTTTLNSTLEVVGTSTFQGFVQINDSANITNGLTVNLGFTSAGGSELLGGNLLNGLNVFEFGSTIIEATSPLTVNALSTFNALADFNNGAEFDGIVQINNTFITDGGANIIFTPSLPGVVQDGQLWVQQNPTTGLFFQDDTSTVQKVWATPEGILPRSALTVGPFNFPVGVPTIIVSENVNIPAGMSALVVATMDLRLTTGDGANNELQVQVNTDVTAIYLQLFFIPSFVGNVNDLPVTTWSWSGYINGPVTTLSIRAGSSFGANIVRGSNARLTILGSIPTSQIL